MRFAEGCALAATSVQAATMLAAIARVEAEEKAKRQDQARSLFRGLSLTAEPMCMSMNTESTNIMDDIINGDDEAKDDYKPSVESEPDGGVISPHELIINPKNSLKEVVSQLVKAEGINGVLDIDIDDITKKFEHHQHPHWKGLSLVDKFVAYSFETVGILGLNHKINEEQSINILTSIVSKANDLESAIAIDEGGGRRLQNFGSNNNLFVAYIQVSRLKLQGLDDESILDQLTMLFTERVVDVIAGVLDIAIPFICPGGSPADDSVDQGGCCETDAQCYSKSELCFLCFSYCYCIIYSLLTYVALYSNR